jgi:hypothetical protein
LQEVAAAQRPADAGAARRLADARFRSGDYEGAAEAFTWLAGQEGASQWVGAGWGRGVGWGGVQGGGFFWGGG